jgi:hypothetical protein
VVQGVPHTQGVMKVLWGVLRVLASLRLTVVLFSLSMLLVFFGTVAQIDKGTWTVVDEYFRSWVVWVPTQLIAKFGWKFFETPAPDAVWSASFPLPGGWLLGSVMLVNLLAAHIMRFKLSWRRAGIITIHIGVILLLLGELITGLFAVESRMVLQKGETTNYIDHGRRVELAVTDLSTGQVVTVPQGRLNNHSTISDPQLPVDIEVIEFLKNTDLHPATGGDDLDGVVRFDGVRYTVVPASEGAGVKSDREDAAAVRVKLLKKGTGEVLAERFLSLWQYENFTGRQYLAVLPELLVDGKRYRFQLRNEHITKPYTVDLLNFEHKQYVGTSTPKDFASTVHLLDPETGDDRQVRIWMNHPLRHRGETFYQHATIFGDTGTVLQVVKNPSWWLPYVSCLIVALGMLIHFGTNLDKFTSRLHAKKDSGGTKPVPDQPQPGASVNCKTPRRRPRGWQDTSRWA